MGKPFQRAGTDHSQRVRRWFQLAFLALNAWIALQFYLFVRYYESGGGFGVSTRPPGVEGWLPIASLMNLKVWLYTGELPGVHPAGVFLLIAFLSISWLMRKSFCSWLCPVGTASQYLAKAGWKLFRKRITLPRWADLALRSVKYILMGLFLYVIAIMSPEEIRVFLGGPYGVVADVKMLNFFRELSVAGLIVIAVLVLLSMFIVNFWCRYLCPYGALLGLLSMLSPLRIKRQPSLCIDCGKCARACPSSLAVDKLITISSAECTSCLSCVASCPVESALYMSVASQRNLPVWAMAAAIAVIFFGMRWVRKVDRTLGNFAAAGHVHEPGATRERVRSSLKTASAWHRPVGLCCPFGIPSNEPRIWFLLQHRPGGLCDAHDCRTTQEFVAPSKLQCFRSIGS